VENVFSPDNNIIDKIISFIEQASTIVKNEAPRAVFKVRFDSNIIIII
jgi:hypothetical protein